MKKSSLKKIRKSGTTKMLENFKQTMKQYFDYMEACDRDGMLGLFAENAQIQVTNLGLL